MATVFVHFIRIIVIFCDFEAEGSIKFRTKQPKCFIAVTRRRNLVYAKDTFSIHTRKQCML